MLIWIHSVHKDLDQLAHCSIRSFINPLYQAADFALQCKAKNMVA